MNIYGKKVILRAIEENDAELIVSMFNDPEVEDLVVGWSNPVSLFSQKEWLKNHFNDQNNLRFIIDTTEDGSIGLVTLHGIDWKNRRATHGLKILNKEYRGKGYGTDTVMAIMRYAFEELNLYRLDAGWFDFNIPSKTMYAKCGWQQEGIRRKYVYKHGEFRDLIVAGILAEEYRALVKKNHYWD